VPIAANAGARVVIVNGGPTEMDAVADVAVQGPIGTLLPRLVAD
jgi:NAD-dependent SIR2 family protein deacetylase